MILFGNRVFLEVIKFKMRSSWIRVGPNPICLLCLREKNSDTWEENILLQQRQRLEQLQGKEHQELPVNHKQLRKGKDRFSPLGFRGGLGLLKPRFQTSNIQKLKNHSFLFYATSLQYFALGRWCTVHPALCTGRNMTGCSNGLSLTSSSVWSK